TEYIFGPFYWDLPLGLRDPVAFWRVANLPVAALLLAFAALDVRRAVVAWVFAGLQLSMLAIFGWVSFTQDYDVLGPLWNDTVLVSYLIAATLPLAAFAYQAWARW